MLYSVFALRSRWLDDVHCDPKLYTIDYLWESCWKSVLDYRALTEMFTCVSFFLSYIFRSATFTYIGVLSAFLLFIVIDGFLSFSKIGARCNSDSWIYDSISVIDSI